MRLGTYAQSQVRRPEEEVRGGGWNCAVGRTALGSLADTPIARIQRLTALEGEVIVEIGEAALPREATESWIVEGAPRSLASDPHASSRAGFPPDFCPTRLSEVVSGCGMARRL